MSVTQKLVTAEGLWEMPEHPGKRFELVGGEVIEVTGAGDRHMAIAEMLYKRLDRFVEQHDLGLVRHDGLPYVLRRGPDEVRVPDVSFVAWERVPEGEARDGFWEGPPTLAVEVVSPNDRANDVYTKAQHYLGAGTRQVWILWPQQRSMTQHDADTGVRELGPDSVLDGGDMLPGFSVRVGDLFEIPQRRRRSQVDR